MARRKSRKSRPPDFECPNCGASVRGGSLACPSCGSDARTGWAEDAKDIWYEDLDGYDEIEPSESSAGPSTVRTLVIALVITIAVIVLVLG